MIGYLLFPVQRARVDLLWFVGGAGLLAVLFARDIAAKWLAIAWTAAACLSIAINGARDLPQYFVQANPALAFGAAAGISLVWRRDTRGASRLALVALVIVGLWKVRRRISTTPARGLPQAVQNTAFDLGYARGRMDRVAYLARFQQQDDAKYVPLSSDRLIQTVRATTNPDDRILVFGLRELDSTRRVKARRGFSGAAPLSLSSGEVFRDTDRQACWRICSARGLRSSPCKSTGEISLRSIFSCTTSLFETGWSRHIR